jgi:GNAT superfamily N-acetyltransferase
MERASSTGVRARRLNRMRVELRDGSAVDVRPIRPTDKRLLREGFDRLSPESRYRRFLSPMPELSERFLAYLTEVDHHDHEALIAIAPDGKGVGVARYVRSTTDPEVAEEAVTVVDDWQGRGVATALLTLLSGRAHTEGIRRFTSLVLAENHEMLEVLEGLSPVRVIDRETGTVEVESELVADDLSPALRELLRQAARRGLDIQPVTQTWRATAAG